MINVHIPTGLERTLLEGPFDELAPILRIGDKRYLRFDSIRFDPREGEVFFTYDGELTYKMSHAFLVPGDQLTITGLYGRIEVEIRRKSE